MDHLIRLFLDKIHNKKVKIDCIGDAMIDEYYEVKVTRINPEHPVPVMLCQNETVRKPGGSANVAYQLRNINADVRLITFSDPSASKIFYKEGLNPYDLGPEAQLPIKRRYVENGLQVGPRLDIEFENCKLTDDQIVQYFDLTKKYAQQNGIADVVILSDYNKGFFKAEENFTSIFPGAITIVDPKSKNLNKWKNCTIFKPNAKEARDLSGLNDWQDQCRFFVNEINCESVIITYSGNGIKGYSNGEFFEYLPEYEHNEVQSVIGAGDCFAAFLGLAKAHGFSTEESSKLAFHAGLVYVRQKNNRPIVLGELVSDKIVAPEDLALRDFDLAFTNGCFDILHKGHLETLKFAKSKAKKLVVAINSDDSVKALKGDTRPVVPFEHRAAVLASLKMVDFVVKFDSLTPLEAIQKIKPDCLIKGGDYNVEGIVGNDLVKNVYVAPFIENFSSSNFINKILP